MEIRHLTDGDVPEAARVFSRALGAKHRDQPERQRAYWDVADSLGAWDGDRLLGIATTFSSSLVVPGGAQVDIAAVPQVGVRPDAHGRGVGRTLLERQVAGARERGARALALNSSEVPIYGRFGYGATSDWWTVETDPRLLAWRSDAPEDGAAVEEVTADRAHELFPVLYARCLGRWHGEVARHDGWWTVALTPRDPTDELLFAVHRGADGRPDAAATYSVELAFDDSGFANRLELHDLFGTDDRAEALLARWLLSRRLLGRVTADRWNPRSAVPWMLEDPRRFRTRGRGDAVWVRLLDVPGVLGARTTDATGALDVRVVDPLVDANDATFHLAGVDGALRIEPTDRAPAVTVPVGLLASLASGWTSATALAAAGRVEVDEAAAVPVLDALLATTTPPWCSTGF